MNTIERVNVTTPEHLDRALRHAASKMNTQSSWFDTLRTINDPGTDRADGPRKRALRAWVAKGDVLDMLQVTLDMSTPAEPKVKTAWSPGARTVKNEGPTYITWDTGSVVELKGMHALRASADIWVGGYEWGKNTLVLVIYRRETGQ